MHYTRFALLFLSLALCAQSERAVIGGRTEPPRDWILGDAPPSHHEVNFVVFVKQQNLHAFEEKFLSISDPDSREYGRFLSIDQAEAMIAPEPDTMDRVESWLVSFPEATVERYSDRFEVRAKVAVASQILGADFYVHTHQHTGKSLVRAHGMITVPERISSDIHFIAGATELTERNTVGKILTSSTSPRVQNVQVTPDLLRKWYNIPKSYSVTKSKKTLNGIAAFNDNYDQGGFESFRAKYKLPPFNVTNTNPNATVADYVESDLDVQYISAMAQGADLFFQQEPQNYWILQFLIDALKLERQPTVFSISYGWFETDQCMWATVNCPKLGYSGNDYVDRTNVAFQLYGSTGVSIFVASGDDGSPSVNCPIDPFVPGLYGPTACPAVTIRNETLNLTCTFPYIQGRGENTQCDQVLQLIGTFDPLPTVAAALAAQNPQCNITSSDDSDIMQTFCICEDIIPATLSGFEVYGRRIEPSGPQIFAPIWPGSSPYVTSVAASYFTTRDGINPSGEVPSDVLLGAQFDSGGGFSYFQKGLPYQAQAKQEWLNKVGARAPPSWSFSLSNRAYPDISFNGNNFDVYTSATESQPVGGTSASSPASAGLFNLVNDVLFQRNKTQLGFLNPLLYKMARESPKTFNDLKKGNNKCDGALCCLYGFEATEGWDPVSGLGSPNFAEIVRYVLNLKK